MLKYYAMKYLTFSYFLSTLAFKITLEITFSTSLSEAVHTLQLLAACKHRPLCCVTPVFKVQHALPRARTLQWIKTRCKRRRFEPNWTAASSRRFDDITGAVWRPPPPLST